MHSLVWGDLQTSNLLNPKQSNCLPDRDALLPNFGWDGKTHIHETINRITQHDCADQCDPMWKHFHTHLPGTNVWRLPNGIQQIPSSPTLWQLMMALQAMVSVLWCKSIWVWTLNYFWTTPCPLNLTSLKPSVTSSNNMALWKD